MSWTNFSIAKLCYTEIKHSDWTYQVMWLLLTNQKALFQNTEAMTISNLFIIGQWLWISLQRGYFRYHKFEVWIQSSTVNIWKDENKEKKRPGVGQFKTFFMTPSPVYAKHLFSCCYCLRSFSCKKVFWLVQFWMKEVESLKDEERLKKTSRRNAEWDRRRRRRLQMMISCVAFITYIGTMGHVSTKSQGTISNHIGRYCVTQ